MDVGLQSRWSLGGRGRARASCDADGNFDVSRRVEGVPAVYTKSGEASRSGQLEQTLLTREGGEGTRGTRTGWS